MYKICKNKSGAIPVVIARPRIAGSQSRRTDSIRPKPEPERNGASARATVRLSDLFDHLVWYRNNELGHGAAGQRSGRFYDRMARALLGGVAEILGPLDVLAETCHLEFPKTDAETAGGLVLDLLGRLGKAGDAVTIDGHRLTILRADPTRIRRIRIEPIQAEVAAESGKAPGGRTG